MIKCSKIKGYKNLGEVQIFSHLYQFIEKDKDIPMVILVHAYEYDTQIFKGCLFSKTQTYKSVPLTEIETQEIEKWTGKVKQVNFNKFIIGTILEDNYKNFKCA